MLIKTINNEKGMTLMAIIIIGFIVASTVMVTILSTNNTAKRILFRRNVVSAFNIAEAGKEHALGELRNGTVIPVTGTDIPIFTNESFEDGSYTVNYDANAEIDTLWISSEGTLADRSTTIDVVCSVNRLYSEINPTIEAAVTALSDVTTLGNIIIDGRDWDAAGENIVGDGVYGIRSCGNIEQGGSSTIGGNGNEPTEDAGVNIIDHLAPSAGYPTTPEEVLGIPAGSLDQYKTTNPPTLPFNGIVYYEAAGDYIDVNFAGSTGIFIIHNGTRTAKIKNMQGTFKGILIADKVSHINDECVIIGAVVTLSSEQGSNAYGNGAANIKYSSQMITEIINTYEVPTDTTFDVVSWRQL